MKNNINKRINKNKGYSLIEVLIALIILSLGMLGISSLQTKTQQYSRSAYFKTKATFFAHDMLETIRANQTGMKASYYNNPGAIEHTTCFSTVGCTALEMAENDMFKWRQRVQNSLPASDSIVCIDSTPDDGTPSTPSCDSVGSVYAIKIWWMKMDGNLERVIMTTAF